MTSFLLSSIKYELDPKVSPSGSVFSSNTISFVSKFHSKVSGELTPLSLPPPIIIIFFGAEFTSPTPDIGIGRLMLKTSQWPSKYFSIELISSSLFVLLFAPPTT